MTGDPLGPKDPEEVKFIKFPMLKELAGATPVSATATATVKKGVDPSPANVLLGQPLIVGTDVLVRMQGGVEGVTYKLRVKLTDDAGNVHVATELVLVQTI